jgi:ABC-type branched-subunit amino acid transport system substrate-binding protein
VEGLVLQFPRVAVASVSVALALTLAACGSQLDPQTVAQAGGTGVGPNGEVAAGGAGAGPDGSVPGVAGDPGAGGADTSGGGTTSTGGTGGDAPQGTGDNDATGGTKAGSCDGFKNQTGITDKSIVLGNASDISGPVPGLFESAQEGARAYVAYFNSTSDICGRKLELKSYDSRTDAAADQQAYTKGCDETFAMVGSMSGFDSGGAATAQSCGLPDIRSASVTTDRQSCTTCYAAQSVDAQEFQNAVPDFVLKNYGDAGDHAAMLYINAGAAAENGKTQAAAMEKRGMTFDYVQGIDISEFNYAPYVQQMKDKGIEYVQFIGAYQQADRLAQAMQQQGFEPKIYLLDPTVYNPDYVEAGGSAVEGTTVFVNFTPFEEAGSNQEVQLYLSWLQQVKPGATPSFFGLFAWSAARLFVERATALGARLSRSALVSDLGGVNNWTANGMHAPQSVGARRTGECWRFIRLEDGKWTPIGGSKYQCSGTTTAG